MLVKFVIMDIILMENNVVNLKIIIEYLVQIILFVVY